MVAFVGMFIIGSFFLLFGFVVWKFKVAKVIAGYNKKKIKDPDGLARWVGKCMMITGISAWILGLLGFMFQSKNSDLFAFMGFMALSMLSGVAALAGAQKYSK